MVDVGDDIANLLNILLCDLVHFHKHFLLLLFQLGSYLLEHFEDFLFFDLGSLKHLFLLLLDLGLTLMMGVGLLLNLLPQIFELLNDKYLR